MAQLATLLCACLLLAVCRATNVRQCRGKKFSELSKNVQLTPCAKVPCELKKGTDQHITINFTPEKDITDITNRVSAEVFSVPLPFIGVDGNSICNKIFNENGDKESCPVKKGTKYVYKDSFPVLDFYPSINVKVKWELTDGKDDIICFEVPAKIS